MTKEQRKILRELAVDLMLSDSPDFTVNEQRAREMGLHYAKVAEQILEGLGEMTDRIVEQAAAATAAATANPNDPS